MNAASISFRLLLTLCTALLVSCQSSPRLDRKEFTVSTGADLPRGRGGHAAGVFGDRIIVVGGTDWSKDHTTKYWLKDSVVFRDGQWRNGPALPHAIGYSQFACDGKSLFVVGGTDAQKKFDTTYILAGVSPSDSWRLGPSLPLKLSSGAAAMLDGDLYVTCGFTDEGLTNRMWRLDTTDNRRQWQECAAIPGPVRAFPAVVGHGGYLYVLSGMSLDAQKKMIVLNDAYQYTPHSNAWRQLADLPEPGYAWSAAVVDDQDILLTGRADGAIHKDIWLVRLPQMITRDVGQLVIQSTTAPLVRAGDRQWRFLGGEPDSLKNRTSVVTVISRVK